MVCSNWKKLARFNAADAESYSWNWDRALAATVGVDTEAMERAFEVDFGLGSATVWS